MIIFPPFEPDKSIYNGYATPSSINAVPVADGWGPMAGPVVQSVPLPEECRGATYYRTASGNTGVIAGTPSNLYILNTSTFPYSWTEISKSTNAYSLNANDRWTFTKYGNQIIASTLSEFPQYYNIALGGTFDDRTTEFKARYCSAVGDYLVFAYLENQENMVRWSALNNASEYTPGKKGSDVQVIATGQEITGIIPDSNNAIIIQRDRMSYMQRIRGGTTTFSITEVNAVRGSIAPFSIVQIGPQRFMYYSEDGFFANVSGDPIGAERVNRWFDVELNRSYMNELIGFNDPINSIIWWRYRNIANEGRLLGYDWRLDRWCFSDANLTEAVSLATPGTTWDGLAQIYPNIDAVNIPFSSPLFKGGRPIFAGFNFDDELVYMAGSNLEARIDTSWVQLTNGRRTRVRECRIDGDAQNYTVTVGRKESHAEIGSFGSPIPPSARAKVIKMRDNALLHQFCFHIPAAEVWNTASGVKDLKANPAGQL